MPRTKEQFNQMKKSRIESLLDSALILYALYGENFTVDQVAEMSKCSHGIIYHYFKNTDEIRAKLKNSRIYKTLKENVVKPYKNVLAKEAIYSIAASFLNVKTFEEICYSKILLEEDGKSSLEDTLLSLISRGQKEGDITGGEPVNIVNCFAYLLKGYYLSIILNHKEKIEKPSFDNLIELFRKKR